MSRRAAAYPALWLCGRLFACGDHSPLSRSEFASVMSPYAPLPASVQRAVAMRTAALGSLMRLADASFPATARILDAGCGHGQMTRWLARGLGRAVVGIDSSEARIASARGSDMPANVQFQCIAVGDYTAVSAEPWDGFVFADTLLYLTPEAQRLALLATRDAAAPGAVMILKDSITEHRWKFHATRLEERVKLRIGYYGNAARPSLTYRSRAEWTVLLAETGWKVAEEHRTPRVLPYPGRVAVCHAV